MTHVHHTDGQVIYSVTYEVSSGVIQGDVDIISPILFILTLDQPIQANDKDSDTVRYGRILKLEVLDYADDTFVNKQDGGKNDEVTGSRTL